MALNEQTDVAPDADPAVSDKPPVEEREPSPEPSAPARIIINPKVFKDKRDGLCVAYNEAFRVIMEMNGFDPQAEPTEEQRKFFSDTAYADDERMLRRTILARVCTFDDSVENPTDEQLDEALEFLETVMEIGAPQSEEEQANVQRIHDMIAEIRKAPRPEETPAEETPVESEAPPVGAVFGGYTRELRREQRERKVLDEYLARTAGTEFMSDVGEGLRTEVGVEPSTEVSGEISARARGDEDEEEENNMLPRADIGGGKARGGKTTDDTYVTNSAVVMPEDKAREMGAVTQGLERVGNGQVSIPFDVFRINGATVDADQLLAESYGSKEAAEAAKNAAMEARARRYSSAPSEAAMKDPESVRVVPTGTRPGPWDEAYLSHAARAGHGNLKTVKSGPFIHTAGYVPGSSLGLVPTRVLGTSSPTIEVRRMLNSQVGETGESAGNGRVVSLTDAANPNKPGWYTADEGYRAAALGSIKGWLTANKRGPEEGDDLAAVMAAAYRDRAGLKLGKIDKNGKDFLASVAKAYEAERKGTAGRKDKEVLEAARNADTWEQVVGARRYDRYSTTA